ncbi:MAG: tyrosine-type recombinase/integrase [Bacteroidia bacterium]|nr:tyrosine-type recombinase/integrase [Bacteroidota bacterium]MBP9922607.1 tyrosine-type recombinase/integrase [Bacteroidia bacterium]
MPRFQLLTLNKNFRKIGELAGWTDLVQKKRRKRGILKELLKFKDGRSYRFCDHISSHTMRRTASTTLLNLGMPEHLVRKISGHVAGSKEFFKYVQYSQNYIDQKWKRLIQN